MVNSTPEALPDWPVFGLADDMRPAMRRAQAAGRPFVLATLVEVVGGGPRPPGTQMVFAPPEVAGYFSGGCVENDVSAHAHACLTDGVPRTLTYGEGSPWPDVRLQCGARIDIGLERIEAGDPALAAILAAETARRPVVYLSDGRTRRCATDLPTGRRWAVQKAYEPAARLIVVGGDPTALAIAELGVRTGFETILIRPKGPAAPPPIPVAAYRRDAPAEALAAVGLDAWTSVAVASHDPDTDREALLAALPSQAPYVGLLGARRRLGQWRGELVRQGLLEAEMARLRAPIGLDIGGKAPFEVALAVIGEIVALRYARKSGNTSTTSPAAAGAAPGGRRKRASASAKTLTSEES